MIELRINSLVQVLLGLLLIVSLFHACLNSSIYRIMNTSIDHRELIMVWNLTLIERLLIQNSYHLCLFTSSTINFTILTRFSYRNLFISQRLMAMIRINFTILFVNIIDFLTSHFYSHWLRWSGVYFSPVPIVIWVSMILPIHKVTCTITSLIWVWSFRSLINLMALSQIFFRLEKVLISTLIIKCIVLLFIKYLRIFIGIYDHKSFYLWLIISLIFIRIWEC